MNAVAVARVAAGTVLFALVLGALVRDWQKVQSTLTLISPMELVLAQSLVLLGSGLSVLPWPTQRVRTRLPGRNRIGVAHLSPRAAGEVSPWELVGTCCTNRAREAGRDTTVAWDRGGSDRGRHQRRDGTRDRPHAPALRGSPDIPSGSGHSVGLGDRSASLALSPPVLTRLVNFVLDLIRRPRISRGVTWHWICTASGWSGGELVASYGSSVAVLAIAAGAPAGEVVPLCLAGVPLAMTAGFLRRVHLHHPGSAYQKRSWSPLGPALGHSDAIVVALIARLRSPLRISSPRSSSRPRVPPSHAV